MNANKISAAVVVVAFGFMLFSGQVGSWWGELALGVLSLIVFCALWKEED